MLARVTLVSRRGLPRCCPAAAALPHEL